MPTDVSENYLFQRKSIDQCALGSPLLQANWAAVGTGLIRSQSWVCVINFGARA